MNIAQQISGMIGLPTEQVLAFRNANLTIYENGAPSERSTQLWHQLQLASRENMNRVKNGSEEYYEHQVDWFNYSQHALSTAKTLEEVRAAIENSPEEYKCLKMWACKKLWLILLKEPVSPISGQEP